jgi:hypothetical protein
MSIFTWLVSAACWGDLNANRHTAPHTEPAPSAILYSPYARAATQRYTDLTISVFMGCINLPDR